MGLLKCIECNTEVSEFADKCPKCGCPVILIKSKSVNKILHLKGLKGISEDITIDFTDFEKDITEENLKNTDLVLNLLTDKYGIKWTKVIVVQSIFEFNNYKFPDNYQACYEEMCARNRAEAQAINAKKPKCPTCSSTNISKISTAKRAGSIISFGILSKNIGKTFECKNCGYKW